MTQHADAIDRDLAVIADQEARLVFETFGPATAWDIGCRLKARAEEKGLGVTIDIRTATRPLFHVALDGTSPDNTDWARRKSNVVLHFGRSSYRIGLTLARRGSDLVAEQGLALRDYASHGGSFPINVRGTGCIGAITVSGLPQRDDHALVVEVLAEALGFAPAEFALPAR